MSGISVEKKEAGFGLLLTEPACLLKNLHGENIDMYRPGCGLTEACNMTKASGPLELELCFTSNAVIRRSEREGHYWFLFGEG